MLCNTSVYFFKLGPQRIHKVRTRGGNTKYRALRLDTGNFAWGSECCARKTRIIDVVYNASNNELVRTKTLVKNAIVVVDATPFRQWYEAHYITPLGRKKGAKLVSARIINIILFFCTHHYNIIILYFKILINLPILIQSWKKILWYLRKILQIKYNLKFQINVYNENPGKTEVYVKIMSLHFNFFY